MGYLHYQLVQYFFHQRYQASFENLGPSWLWRNTLIYGGCCQVLAKFRHVFWHLCCQFSSTAHDINLKPLQLLTALFEDMSDNPHREGWQDSGSVMTGCFGPKVLLGFIWDQQIKRSPNYQIMTFKVISPDFGNASRDRLTSGIFSFMRYSRLIQVDQHDGCEMSCNWEGWINRRTSSRRAGLSGRSGGSHFLPWIRYCLETSSHSWVGIGCFHTNSNINSTSALPFLMFVSPEVEEPARAAEAGQWILRAC